MIDVHALRKQPQEILQALKRKGAYDDGLALLNADSEWRDATHQYEELRARQKISGKPTPEQITELQVLKAKLQQAEAMLAEADERRRELLDRIPNPPDESAPDGTSEEDAEELRRVGEPRPGDGIRDHVDLAGPAGWIDMNRGVKVSGSRFVYRTGPIALLELALYRFALDRLVREGFVPVLPPVLVREPIMYGTGFLPTDEVNIYRVERDDLYLTGTSEVAIAGLHMGEILDEDALPLRYAGYSTCFRREAGAAGKDTRGMFRVHQFDKVEMFAYTHPEASRDEHERILSLEEGLVGELGVPYRVVNIAAGDLGGAASKKYDIEAWFPTQGRYREITSCSNTTDYQARRLDIRFRGDGGPRHVHTLNGTAVTARAMLALLENFQDEGGAVSVPEVLVDFGAPARIEPPG